MASTTIFEGSPSLHPGKSQYYANDGSTPRVSGYDRYLAGGPQHNQSDIELTKMDSVQEPLLSPYDHHQQRALVSQQSFSPSLSPMVPSLLYQDPLTNSREAPMHRPQEGAYAPAGSDHIPVYSPEPPYYQSPTPSPHQQYPPTQYPLQYSHHSRQSSNNHMGGPRN